MNVLSRTGPVLHLEFERVAAAQTVLRRSATLGWIAAIVVLLLVAGPALPWAFGSVDAQSFTTRVLVKNLAKTTVSGNGSAAKDAQRFRTGSNSAGYRVTEIRIALGNNGSDVSTSNTYAVIRENTSDNLPGDKLMDMVSPSSFSDFAQAVFTPASKLVLEPDTNYWLVTNDQFGANDDSEEIAVRLT